MYREPVPTLVNALDLRLSQHAFAVVEPDDGARDGGVSRLYRRKTWNTHRGVLLARASEIVAWPAYVETLRAAGARILGSSWWNQLGLQLVVETEAAPVPEATLQGLVDAVNSQSVLVQSVFVYQPTTGAHGSARTWGQMITGKFQDAILAAIHDVAPSVADSAVRHSR